LSGRVGNRRFPTSLYTELVNSIIIFVAKYFLYLSILIVGVYWFRSSTRTKVNLGWQLVVGGVVALALSVLASHLYYDTRPFVSQHLVPLIAHAPDNGFPSDHALFTSFLGFTMLMYSRRIGALLLLIALLVGAARVAAHLHNPVDILGSFAIAALAVALVQLVAKFWNDRRRTSASNLS
jgi:undecaprenyl-diphosphatase